MKIQFQGGPWDGQTIEAEKPPWEWEVPAPCPPVATVRKAGIKHPPIIYRHVYALVRVYEYELAEPDLDVEKPGQWAYVYQGWRKG